MKKITLLIIALIFCGAFAARLQAVEVGQPAPKLTVSKWIKGGPVKLAKGKNYYIVEFWATWCGPCRSTIPHLSELQKKYAGKGLVVVGISGESVDKIQKFVAAQKDMDYNVAADKDRATDRAYMGKRSSIPTAFLVGKDGKVLWIGHPMALDPVLEKVFAGKFNAENYKKLTSLESQLKKAMRGNDINKVTALCDKILALDPVNQTALNVRLVLYQKNNQMGKALVMLETLAKRAPQEEALYFLRLRILRGIGRPEKEVKALADEILKQFAKKPLVLSSFAMIMLDGAKVGEAYPGYALRAMLLAKKNFPADMDSLKKGAAMNTLAMCYFNIGLIDKAMEIEKQAVKLTAKGKRENEQTVQLLKYYQKVKALNKQYGK